MLYLYVHMLVSGPHLPLPRSSGRAVPYGDTFLVLGGSEYGSIATPFLDTILQFDPDNELWIHLEQRLPEKTIVPVAMFVPDDFPVECV